MITGLTMEETVLRLLIATVCGLLIGVERDIKHRPAGMRTFMLVSLGSAAFTLVVLNMVSVFADPREGFSIDPTRLVQGVIGGIGFLGAGALIHSQGGEKVRGIATGAGIWVAGAIGVSCGLGLYELAGMVTAIAFFILLVMGLFEDKFRDVAEEKLDNGIEASEDG